MSPSGKTAVPGRAADKLRAYGIVAAVSLWTVAAWTLATPGRIDRNGTLKGVDFSALWLSGRLVVTDRVEQLYDREAWAGHFAELFPDAPGLLYYPNYPPIAALVFAPLGGLPFGPAVALWTLISVLLYAGCCAAVWRRCPHLAARGGAVAALAAASPAFFLLVLNGQTTALVLAAYTGAWVAFHRGSGFWMGAAFGLAAVKPHFVIIPAIVFLLTGSWRALGGLAASGLAQLALVAAVLGTDVIVEFTRSAVFMMQNLELFEPKRWQAHGLKNALDLLMGTGAVSSGIFTAVSVWLIAQAVRIWKGASDHNGLKFALLLLVSAVLNPHLNGYDLVVLAPAFLLVADWMAAAGSASPDLAHKFKRVAFVMAGVYLMPLLAPLAALTRVQVTPVLMILLFCSLANLVNRQTAAIGTPAVARG